MICYEKRLALAAQKLSKADCIVIGGGAGLSDAAGLHYAGPAFERYFAAFIARYGFTDLYTSSFHPFKTAEERWAYWAAHIRYARYAPQAMALYKNLYRLVQGKPCFVITTNVDHQFRKAGFPAEGIFAVQGDYGRFQCARRCHDTLYDNEAAITRMLALTENCRIPPSLVPTCPRCGEALDVYVHKDQFFVMGDAWHEDQRRYADFLQSHENQRIVFFELGVGFNTPGIIRIPFEQFAHSNPNATLLRANRDHPGGPKENAGRTLSFSEDMSRLVAQLYEAVHAL